jgi:lantibiotic biosynthesis protein
MARATALYQHHGVAMLRASTDPGGLDLPGDLEPDGPDGTEQVTAWLRQTWQRQEVRDAICAGSPSLAREISTLTDGCHGGAPEVRRTMLSLASYLLRWQRRPTPFGLFAGVAAVRTAPRSVAHWGGKDQIAARPDAAWLAGLTSRLEQHPALLDRLPVLAHSAGAVRGPRLCVPGRPVDGSANLTAVPLEVGVRLTGPVRAAMEHAQAPIVFANLRERISRQFPAASADRVTTMLHGLVASGFLITSLRAMVASTGVLDHLCAQLAAAGAEQLADLAPTVQALNAIRDHLAEPAPDLPTLAELAGQMRAMSPGALPLMVDTVLDCDVAVTAQVLTEAADAAGLLYRLSPHPVGYPAWRDYHARFRARYGAGALVPLLDLVADSGLGYPAGYLGSAGERAARKLTARDETILNLVQRAQTGGGEIVLTDQVIEQLAPRGETFLPAPRAEIGVEVRATSLDTLARGRFELLVTASPRPGSSMAGRFAHLLADQDCADIAATYAAGTPGALAAQLSFAPRKRSNENLTRTARLLPDVISIGEHHQADAHTLTPADLLVGADAHRLYLVHAATGTLLEPRVTHALEAGTHTPALARFIAELSTARCAVYKAFDFGAASNLTYLPRVRYRRTVLAPARWRIAAGDLPGHSSPTTAWEEAFAAWKSRWQVPDHVAVVNDDRRLPVDLRHRIHRMLVRTHLDRHTRIELRECADPQRLSWIGRAHELLIPLTLTAAPTAPTTLSAAGSHSSDPDPALLPGGAAVLYTRLHAHPARYDEILLEHLPHLTGTVPNMTHWWFTRHRQMAHPEADQYLGLYLALTGPDAYAEAADRLHAWAMQLRRDRLCSEVTFATYHPQPGRYGPGPALAAAEQVFATDTAAALTQITVSRGMGISGQALAAVSMVELCDALAPTTQAAMAWIIEHLPRTGKPLPTDPRDQTLAWSQTGHAETAAHAAVTTAWKERSDALATYRRTLPASANPLAAARSLLHQHHVRALGVDPDTERTTERLARAIALRHHNRQP